MDANTDQLVCWQQVKEMLEKLPQGTDDIPAELLKDGVDDLLEPLTGYLQLLHLWKLTPTIWHRALVVPIWKNKGTKDDIANYCPISLTCTGR